MKSLWTIVAVLLFTGCGKHWSDQIVDEINGGSAADFTDGRIDGYSVYGFDASFLNGNLCRYIKGRKDIYRKTSIEDIPQGDLTAFFAILKFDCELYKRTRSDDFKCFRLQYGTFKRVEKTEGLFANPVKKSFTFFLVTKHGEVHILCVDCSRNAIRSHWRGGRDFEYGTRDVKIGIWDAQIPERNHPEQVLSEEYEDVFAIVTDSPFNYLAYATLQKVEELKSFHEGSLLKLVWRTPECMVFLPDCLCPDDAGEGSVRQKEIVVMERNECD